MVNTNFHSKVLIRTRYGEVEFALIFESTSVINDA